MTEKASAGRKPRVDGERNRERLMKAAKRAFAEKGPSANLNEIAREAGVGIATLFRHFATREALIGQLYQSEGDQLVQAAEKLIETERPVDALRLWLLLFVDYLSTKKIMADVLALLGNRADQICAASGEKLIEACDRLLRNARLHGGIRHDVEPLDLLTATSGGAHLGYAQDWEKGAGRLIDIIIAGLTCER